MLALRKCHSSKTVTWFLRVLNFILIFKRADPSGNKQIYRTQFWVMLALTQGFHQLVNQSHFLGSVCTNVSTSQHHIKCSRHTHLTFKPEHRGKWGWTLVYKSANCRRWVGLVRSSEGKGACCQGWHPNVILGILMARENWLLKGDLTSTCASCHMCAWTPNINK